MLTVFVALCAVLLLAGFMLLPGESDIAQRAPFWGVNVAHRGLHTKDKRIPENSLAAFAAAVDEGYGIELDVQLSKDGEAVVFHDCSLERVCGAPGLVREHTWGELSELRLENTQNKIPLLRQALELVNGQAPLVIELKTCRRSALLCRAVWRVLRQYNGDVCVQSFDPRIVRWFKRNTPGLLRGQLAARPKRLGSGPFGFFVGYGFANFLGRPHYIAYEKGPRPFTVRFAQRFAMRAVWTLGPSDNAELLENKNDMVLFEFYSPLPRYADPPAEPTRRPAEEEYRF